MFLKIYQTENNFNINSESRYLVSYAILLSFLLAIKDFLWDRVIYVDVPDDYYLQIIWSIIW